MSRPVILIGCAAVALGGAAAIYYILVSGGGDKKKRAKSPSPSRKPHHAPSEPPIDDPLIAEKKSEANEQITETPRAAEKAEKEEVVAEEISASVAADPSFTSVFDIEPPFKKVEEDTFERLSAVAKSEPIDIADSGATVDTDEGDEDNNANEVSEAGSEEVVSSSPNAKRFLAGNSNSLDDISSREKNDSLAIEEYTYIPSAVEGVSVGGDDERYTKADGSEEDEEEARDTFDPEPPIGASKAAAAADEMKQFESATSEWMKATTDKLREENGDRFTEVEEWGEKSKDDNVDSFTNMEEWGQSSQMSKEAADPVQSKVAEEAAFKGVQVLEDEVEDSSNAVVVDKRKSEE